MGVVYKYVVEMLPYIKLWCFQNSTRSRHFVAFCLCLTQFGIVTVLTLLASNNLSNLLTAITGVQINFCYVILMIGAVVWPFIMIKSPMDFWWVPLRFAAAFQQWKYQNSFQASCGWSCHLQHCSSRADSCRSISRRFSVWTSEFVRSWSASHFRIIYFLSSQQHNSTQHKYSRSSLVWNKIKRDSRNTHTNTIRKRGNICLRMIRE